MTVKVTAANGGSDSVDFINASGTTLAQVKGYDDGSSNGHLELYTTASGTSTERVRVDKDGNVGIGTSSPSNFSGYTTVDIRNAATGGVLQLGSTAAAAGYVFGDVNLFTMESFGTRPLVFSTNGSQRARIDSSGNLLVGTTSRSSTERLKVDNTDTLVAWFQQSTNTSGYNGITVGLGQNGNNTSTSFFRGNTNNVGNWYLYGNGTTSFSSDERLKKNIETTRDGYIDDVMKLRVVKYNWKKDEDGTPKELGLIAQEVEQVFAGLVQDDVNPVSEDDDTVYKQVKQSVLPFILLKAIQEQQALISSQAAAITALTESLATLTERITALEAK